MKAATARINALATRIFGGTNPYLLMSLPALVVMLALFTITSLCACIASAFAQPATSAAGKSIRAGQFRSIPCTTASTTRTPTRRTSGGGD